MKNLRLRANVLGGAVNILMLVIVPLSISAEPNESIAHAITSGKAYADLRLRLETVEQDNSNRDAKALILRTKLGYKTAEFYGLTALVEFEDSRDLLGVDDFSVPPTGFRSGEFSVIADPNSTEVDQAFIQYRADKFSAKFGRQVITLDNHRFVGHVGWRQDRQTFDALTLNLQVSEALKIQAAKLGKRNRIFSDEADIDSDDTLLNVWYQTTYGTLGAYAYLLEVDQGVANSNDTFGVRFSGSRNLGNIKIEYLAELASQEDYNNIDTDYLALEAGAVVSGISAKIGCESLGSDNGAGAFVTPLATLHKFNGWTDQFLNTPALGLEDVYISLSGKLAGGKWTAIYHDFSSDISSSNGGDDLGDELNLVYTRTLSNNYYAGAKYGDYASGDANFGKVDTRKIWLWAGVKF
jgi:hypothetical protein